MSKKSKIFENLENSKNFQSNPTKIIEISEIAGLFAADGSMQRGHICFWGNPKSDKEYYDNHLKKLFLKAFNFVINPHEKPSNSVYGFYVCDKTIINFFNEVLEYPFGNKTYTLRVPNIIYQNKNKEVIRSFVRGFFSGDGCLNFDKRYANDQKILKIIHTYPRIQLKCVSKLLIYQLAEMVNRLNIKNFVSTQHSHKENEVDSYTLQISGKIMLDKWVKEIGFPNANHSSRYEIFKKQGFVPPNTTYNQRKDILEGRIDPWSFYPKWACSIAWITRQPSMHMQR